VSASLLTVVSLIGAAQGVLLAVAILSRRRAEAASQLLGLLLLLGGLGVGLIALSHSPLGSQFLHQLTVLEYTAWLLLSPLVYLYMQRSTGGRSGWPLALHLLPAAAWLAELAAQAAGLSGGVWWPPVLGLMAYQALYTALSIQLLVERWDQQAPTGIHRFWTRAWLVVLLLQHVAQAVRYAWSDVRALEDVVPLTGALSFLALTVLGFRRSGLLGGEGRRARARYAGSSLSEERAAEIERRLRTALEADRRFLEPDLTLEKLADDLGAPRNHVSQVVNERFEMGFLELLQGLRVDEARHLLTAREGSHLTIEAIASRSGFNSRSAFYDSFRKATGMTPALYRDQQRSR
jgi:AraC-like DNA-binding protein